MKNLQKKMLIASGTLVIGSAAVFNFLMAQPQEQSSDLTLANIEALSAIRDFDLPDENDLKFYFNGQYWERDPKSTTSSSWWPSTISCRRPDGSSGAQIVCTGGGGNCWNGTSCI